MRRHTGVSTLCACAISACATSSHVVTVGEKVAPAIVVSSIQECAQDAIPMRIDWRGEPTQLTAIAEDPDQYGLLNRPTIVLDTRYITSLLSVVNIAQTDRRIDQGRATAAFQRVTFHEQTDVGKSRPWVTVQLEIERTPLQSGTGEIVKGKGAGEWYSHYGTSTERQHSFATASVAATCAALQAAFPP